MRYLILASILTSWSLCEGATITVDHRGRGDYLEIQEAIDAARDRDEVVVRPGEYVITEPIDFNRGVGEGEPKNIALSSEASLESVVIEGALAGLRTGASLSGLTVIAGARGGIRVPPGESPASGRYPLRDGRDRRGDELGPDGGRSRLRELLALRRVV